MFRRDRDELCRSKQRVEQGRRIRGWQQTRLPPGICSKLGLIRKERRFHARRQGGNVLALHGGSRKVFLQNSLITRTARRHHVGAFLTKAETVTKAAAAKDEVRSGACHLKARAFQNVPAQHATDNNFEIPAADGLAMLTFKRDEFGAASFIARAYGNLVQPAPHISSRIALQSAQKIRTADRV